MDRLANGMWVGLCRCFWRKMNISRSVCFHWLAVKYILLSIHIQKVSHGRLLIPFQYTAKIVDPNRTLCSRVFRNKPVVPETVKKLLAFCVTRRFIAVFGKAHHLSLCWARWIQPILCHPVSLRCSVVLSCHLCLGHPNGSFLQVYPPNPSHPYVPHAPTHLILLDMITWMISVKHYKSWSSSLCSLLHSPVTSS